MEIRRLGYIPNAAKYMKAFDVCVIPSLKEGLPYVLLEAMQAGIEIIATDVGGIREALEAMNYYNYKIVPPSNKEALYEAINPNQDDILCIIGNIGKTYG